MLAITTTTSMIDEYDINIDESLIINDYDNVNDFDDNENHQTETDIKFE